MINTNNNTINMNNNAEMKGETAKPLLYAIEQLKIAAKELQETREIVHQRILPIISKAPVTFHAQYDEIPRGPDSTFSDLTNEILNIVSVLKKIIATDQDMISQIEI